MINKRIFNSSNILLQTFTVSIIPVFFGEPELQFQKKDYFEPLFLSNANCL